MPFFDKVNASYDSLTNREKQVADFMCAYSDKAMSMNTKDLGMAAGASSATVVRLARTLGYVSFQQMIIDLARSEKRIRTAPAVAPGNPLLARLTQLLSAVQTSIAQTSSLVSLDVLQQAADQINTASTIYLYGVGTSGLVAQDLLQKLIFINRRSIYHSDHSLNIAEAAHISIGDLAIGFSYSGRNQDVLFAMESAKHNGAKTIGFTRAHSQLSKLVDLHIMLPHVDDQVFGETHLSRYTQSIAVDMLYMLLLHDGSRPNRSHLDVSTRLVDKHRAQRKT